ncbi:MAG: hypothetical protein ACP5I8_16245 [Phycisphaerae bacterium]
MTSYILHIEYGGLVVDGQTQNVSVGQQIPLTAEYGPSDMTLQWNVEGTTIVSSYTANSTTARVTPVTSADLAHPNLTYYWVYTDSGSTGDENVTLTGTLPQPPTAAAVVKTTFDVFEPNATFTGTIEGTTTADDNYVGDQKPSTGAWVSADAWLHFGGSYNPPRDASGTYTPGIEFNASWTLPPAQYGHTFTCVQVITENEIDRWDSATNLTQRTASGADYLDTSYPYGWEVSNQTSASTSDSPAADVRGWTGADYSIDADMYLMFTPSGTDSIPVPVKQVDWSWAGLWPPPSGTTSQPQVLTPSQEPQWTANIKSVISTQVVDKNLENKP